ncbi:hypothetical protein AAG570_012579 [Ranatra chinensis]|uniref:Uncharacterized protein n=1 Tax=Ranatra chinensis TaxID=642074 RepID=A0ABD0YG79_9HEMI
MLGIQRLRTSAYVERWHRSLKAALPARLDSANWVRHLPSILLGLRVVMREDNKTCIAELVFGRRLRLPGDLFSDTQPAETEALLQQLRETFRSLQPALFRSRGTQTHECLFPKRLAPVLTSSYVTTPLEDHSHQPTTGRIKFYVEGTRSSPSRWTTGRLQSRSTGFNLARRPSLGGITPPVSRLRDHTEGRRHGPVPRRKRTSHIPPAGPANQRASHPRPDPEYGPPDPSHSGRPSIGGFRPVLKEPSGMDRTVVAHVMDLTSNEYEAILETDALKRVKGSVRVGGCYGRLGPCGTRAGYLRRRYYWMVIGRMVTAQLPLCLVCARAEYMCVPEEPPQMERQTTKKPLQVVEADVVFLDRSHLPEKLVPKGEEYPRFVVPYEVAAKLKLDLGLRCAANIGMVGTGEGRGDRSGGERPRIKVLHRVFYFDQSRLECSVPALYHDVQLWVEWGDTTLCDPQEIQKRLNKPLFGGIGKYCMLVDELQERGQEDGNKRGEGGLSKDGLATEWSQSCSLEESSPAGHSWHLAHLPPPGGDLGGSLLAAADVERTMSERLCLIVWSIPATGPKKTTNW